jgi:hypothetical protein
MSARLASEVEPDLRLRGPHPSRRTRRKAHRQAGTAGEGGRRTIVMQFTPAVVAFLATLPTA